MLRERNTIVNGLWCARLRVRHMVEIMSGTSGSSGQSGKESSFLDWYTHLGRFLTYTTVGKYT